MDIRSLTFGGLVIGGRSLVGRQDRIFGGNHHGGALVIQPLRMLGEILALSTNFEFPRRKNTRCEWAGGTFLHCLRKVPRAHSRSAGVLQELGWKYM
jgi:hypothetical protein